MKTKTLPKSLSDFEREMEAPISLLLETKKSYSERKNIVKKTIESIELGNEVQRVEDLLKPLIREMLEKYGEDATVDIIDYFINNAQVKMDMEQIEKQKEEDRKIKEELAKQAKERGIFQ